MDDGKLKSILENEIDNAIGYLDSETTQARTKALEFYLRQPYGNEVEGRSQIVTGEVAEAIDGALPQLIRVFTQSDDIVRFEPKHPGDEEGAKQATDYCNWVFYSQNPGFTILHNWFKDALLQKNGVVKCYWDIKQDVTKEEYRGLTDDELVMLLSDGKYEIVAQDTTVLDGGVGDDGAPIAMQSHDVIVAKRTQSGSVKVENVPPEEFLISKRARAVADSPFVAHRKLLPRSDLIAMGFDPEIVANLPSFNDLSFTDERLARYSRGEQPDDDASLDESMQEVEVYEAYLRTDYDGDGVAELRQIFYAGSDILSNEETDYLPFHSLCPIPIPHKFYGESLADRAMDIQLIKSTVVRQMLDNLYLSNNSRVGAVEGQVNLDDLLTMTPGGVVRMKNPNAIVPLNVPSVIAQAFPMLQYLDDAQSKRTGVSDMQQGLNPDVLQNVTAAAVAASTQAAGGKLELIARIFAETGVRTLFQGILQLLCKYQDKPTLMRMRGKYIPIDPRSWSNEYDVDISVGLGTGNKAEQMTMLQMVLAKQEAILQQFGPANPLVSVGQYRNTLGRFIEAAGFTDSAEFFKEVTPEIEQQLAQPQQPQPDPTVQALIQQSQAQIQIAQQKAQADVQAAQQKAMADIELQREKAAAEIQIQREKAQASLQLKQEELQAEIQLKAAQLGADITRSVNIPSVG
jgi:F0F1-type ATP synthase membrane subunit b/b'